MSLNIPLVDSWRLRSDASNIILERVTNDRVQEQYFHGTIESAIESFIQHKIKGYDATTLFGLAQSIKTLQTALNRSLTPLHLEVVEAKQ